MKEESDDEEKEAGSEGERLRSDLNEIAILDIDDELADDEVPLPLQISSGYFLVSSARNRYDATAGYGLSLKGIIKRQAQARTRHLYDFRVLLYSNGCACSYRWQSTPWTGLPRGDLGRC